MVKYLWKDIFFDVKEAEDSQTYGEALASVFDRDKSLEEVLISMGLNGINEMDQVIFNALGHLYSNSGCYISQCIQRAIINCSAFRDRCGVHRRTSQFIVSSNCSLTTFRDVFRGEGRKVKCTKKCIVILI